MSVQVAEGLFEQAEDGARLIGSRCRGCGTTYFPQAPGCRNPDCPAPCLECAHLPQRGRLVSYTIQRYRPPPLFRMDDWTPYAIGLVDLGEGVEVMGMLTGVDLDRIVIGTSMRLVIETLYTDAARGPVATYKFAPEVTA
ncbi:Zn-ribbon domain-containing OB-fold protein [Sphingomonas sp. XXL09]|uniref:Zn-ribbon domain-containing OB-fold protein n=1 Tax=Sphingomonas sp. XXL09 TaxID=3457787 RepID=UPI00406BA8AF